MNSTIKEIIRLCFDLRKRGLNVSLIETSEQYTIRLYVRGNWYQKVFYKALPMTNHDFLVTIRFLRRCL